MPALPTQPPEVDLSGEVAVVTGASRGLGRSIALALANAGAEVVVVARNEAGLEQTAEVIRESTGRPALACRADVTSAAEVEEVRERTESQFGTATVLVERRSRLRAPRPLLADRS